MKHFRLFLSVIFIVFFCQYSIAVVWNTVQNGSFTDASTWSPSGVPNVNTPGDSIFINDDLYIPATGQYIISAYLHIRMGASLYTPNQTRITAPGKVVVWGYLDIHNNMWMDPGGILEVYYGGLVFVDNKVDYTGGGSITLIGGTICWHNLWKGGPPNGYGVLLHGQCYGSTGPLGISLISFEAQKKGSEIHITWATENEENNDYFTVERSADLTLWEVVGTVPGSLYSSGILNYETTDPAAPPGVQYYRLSQTDVDGEITVFSGPWIRYIEVDTPAGWLVYPNPTSNSVTLAKGLDPKTKVKLYNGIGQLIVCGNLQDQQSAFNLENYDPGIYFFAIEGYPVVRVLKNK